MTSQSPRIYTYKITFVGTPYYYYGVHKEKKFEEEYWGTPKTHKWCWKFYEPEKQILELFDYTDGGWEEAQLVEKRLIRPVLNEKFCLNESCGGFLSIEQKRMGGRIGGKITGRKNWDDGIGLATISKEQRVENGRKASKKDKSRAGKIGAKRLRELGNGIFSLTKQQRSETCKKVATQKWMCLETGYVSNPAGLSRYQRARGIDTSKRKRIE
jgi:hypothetical protein